MNGKRIRTVVCAFGIAAALGCKGGGEVGPIGLLSFDATKPLPKSAVWDTYEDRAEALVLQSFQGDRWSADVLKATADGSRMQSVIAARSRANLNLTLLTRGAESRPYWLPQEEMDRVGRDFLDRLRNMVTGAGGKILEEKVAPGTFELRYRTAESLGVIRGSVIRHSDEPQESRIHVALSIAETPPK